MKITAHIEFFGRIRRKRIGAGQVNNVKMVTLVVQFTGFSINGYPTIVTHMFMSTACHVEKRRLSAIRITDERHVDCTPFAVESLDKVAIVFANLGGIGADSGRVVIVGNNFNKLSLVTS